MTTADHSRWDWYQAYLNGALWAFGNGLVSTTLITYLAKDLGAVGIHVSLILAFPNLAGVFRLIAPWVIERFPNRQRFAIAAFIVSGILLLALPYASQAGVLATKEQSLLALILLWGGWHFFMYLALIPFFSWLGDLAPGEERASFLSVREAFFVTATILGTSCSAWINSVSPKNGLIISAYLGGGYILASIVPLVFMSHRPRRTKAGQQTTHEMFAVLVDHRYWPLLAFNLCFAFANGITAAAIGIYPYKFLGLSAAFMLGIQTYMRVGQVVNAPIAGYWLRTSGHAIPMSLAQLLVSGGPLFYLLASKEQPYWIYGAWTCWIAYVVLNIGLPSLMLKLSPDGNSPAYIAVNMATSGLAFALSSILGGWALDYWKNLQLTFPNLSQPLNIFQLLLIFGIFARLSTIVWLWCLREEESDTIKRLD